MLEYNGTDSLIEHAGDLAARSAQHSQTLRLPAVPMVPRFRKTGQWHVLGRGLTLK